MSELDCGKGYESGEGVGEGFRSPSQGDGCGRTRKRFARRPDPRGSTTKPFVSSVRLMISSRSPGDRATASLTW